jgi:hypothetical protein
MKLASLIRPSDVKNQTAKIAPAPSVASRPNLTSIHILFRFISRLPRPPIGVSHRISTHPRAKVAFEPVSETEREPHHSFACLASPPHVTPQKSSAKASKSAKVASTRLGRFGTILALQNRLEPRIRPLAALRPAGVGRPRRAAQ